jgi:hypothetical protein
VLMSKRIVHGSDEELTIVLEAFQSVAHANLQDAIDLLEAARKEQKSTPFPIEIDLVVRALNHLARDYKPNKDYPLPRPKWLIDRIRGTMAYGLKMRHRDLVSGRHARSSDRHTRVQFLIDAMWLTANTEFATDRELNYVNTLIETFRVGAPDEFREALGVYEFALERILLRKAAG